MRYAKYLELIRIDMIEKATYIWNQLVWGGIMAVIIFIFVHVWTAIYAERTTIEGYSLAQMIWYLAMAETMMFATGQEFIERIGEDVKTGTVAISLLKPLNYVGREFAHVFSNFLFKIVVIGSIGLFIAQAMVGMISFHLWVLPLFFVAAVFALILNYLIVTSLGLSAFWFEDSKSVFFIYQKFIFILGGMLVPLEIYPAWLKSVLYYLPTAFFVYAPARLFVAFSWDFFFHTLIWQVLWSLVFAGVLALVYRAGIRRVSINGG